MLSEGSKIVYEILRNLAGEDETYKVIDADEVIEKFPEGVSFTKQQLSVIIKELKDAAYISVKFFTVDEYCLATLKKIEPVVVEESVENEETTENDVNNAEKAVKTIESAKNQNKQVESQNKNVKGGSLLFLSFLGAFLGGGIVTTIAVLLMKFL